MKLRTYKVLRGYYDEVKEKELHMPEGVSFLRKEGQCGDCVHTGHDHYISILPKTDYNQNDIDMIMKADKDHLVGYHEFGDYHIMMIRDIKFIDEFTEITSTEVMELYKFNEYYIVWKKVDYWDDEVIEDIRSGKITIKEAASQMTKGKIYKVGKILHFGGPFDITLFNVHTGNYFDDRPLYGMDVVRGVELKNIISDYNIFARNNDELFVTKDPSYFEQLKNEVLYQIDNYTE